MTASLTTALRIGTSGMQLAQVSLATVSHNVVNANTVGYSRQIVQTGSASVAGYGNGVQLQAIQRIKDEFLGARQSVATSDLAYAQTKLDYMNSIESLFSTSASGGGLDEIVSSFMDAMGDLANEPDNTALRQNVVQAAGLLCTTLNSTSEGLTTTGRGVDSAIDSEISNINQVIKEISALNAQISGLNTDGSSGSNTNDLMDMRDQKIAQLAELFPIQVTQNSTTGAVRIVTENGRKLVDEGSYALLTRTGSTNAYGYQGIGVQNVKVDGTLDDTVFPINTGTLTSGKIKALVDVRDDVVPKLIDQLDEFATTFAAEFNKVASRGSSYPAVNSLSSGNHGTLSGTGSDLFTYLSPSLKGATLNISVVDSQGDPNVTTATTIPVTLPTVGPFSMDDLVALINNNATVGNAALQVATPGSTQGVIATATTDMSGNPVFTIRAANSNSRIVLANGSSGDVLGLLGMNNVFTGTSAATLAVKSSLITNPDTLPVGVMRSTDGGLSSQNNQGILAMVAFAETRINFSAAGDMGPQTSTANGYTSQILSNLAVKVSDAQSRQSYAESIDTQLEELASSVSGVNLNEELSNMLVYQNAFQASSRIITVINKLLEDLVSII